MEILVDNMNRKNTTVWDDSSFRMLSRPPPACSPGKGKGYEDYGSTWPKNHNRPSTNTYTAASTSKVPANTNTRRTYNDIAELSDSDDELSLISKNSQPSDAFSSAKRTSKLRKEHSEEVRSEIESDNHTIRSGSMPKYEQKWAFKFTKNKRTHHGDVYTEGPPPPSSSLCSAQEQEQDSTPSASYTSKPPASRSRGQGKGVSMGSRPKRREEPPTDLDDSPPPFPPRAKPRPRRVTRKKSGPYDLDDDEVVSTPAYKPRPQALPTRESHSKEDLDASETAKDKTSKTGRKIQKFPLDLSPVVKERRPTTANGRVGDKRKALEREIPLPSPLSSQKDRNKAHSGNPSKHALPLPSPLSKRNKPKAQKANGGYFPKLSPLSSPGHHRYSPKDKGKRRTPCAAQQDDDDDDDELALVSDDEVRTRGGLRPFPMSTQMLRSIKRTPSPNYVGLAKSGKIFSDDSDMESERSRKRKKRGESTALAGLHVDNSQVDEDSLYINIDPSTLCPYCDEPLPAVPTQHLRNLLETTKRKSYPAPRVTNPRGLKAALPVYISVCQRHIFETYHLPLAESKGWPQEINFKEVPARVESLREHLESIILDAGVDEDFVEGNEDEVNEKGARRKCVFWKEVMKEVKKQGSRAVAGVKGQFESFEKMQPGYYGELGSVIIHQTLYSLFPPSSFDPSLIAPLTPAEFIQRILVPEAAVELIMEDLCIDKGDAVKTLRESAQYGVAMFPDTDSAASGSGAGGDGDEEDMGVADQIVMERARVRRMELEIEERIEEQMLMEEKADRKAREKEIKAKTNAAEKRKKKAQERKKEATSDEESYVPRATKSRRKRTDESSVAATESEADEMSIASDVSRRSTRTTGRNYTKQITCGSKLANASDMEIGSNTDRSESVEVLEEPKARNRRRCAPSYESVAISSEENIGNVPSVNALQAVDEDPTPRPRRIVESIARYLPSRQPSTSALSSTNDFLPLQVARAKAISTYDAHWQKNFRAPVSNDGHSSESSETRTIHQYAWLLSDEGSSSRSCSP